MKVVRRRNRKRARKEKQWHAVLRHCIGLVAREEGWFFRASVVEGEAGEL